jgi:hypothetical protein
VVIRRGLNHGDKVKVNLLFLPRGGRRYFVQFEYFLGCNNICRIIISVSIVKGSFFVKVIVFVVKKMLNNCCV